MADNGTLLNATTWPPDIDNVTTVPTTLDDTVTTVVPYAPSDTPFYQRFRDEPWVIPLVALSAVNIFAILVFEVYVLYKSCGGRRHLFLGQVLLFALFMCSLLGLAYVPEPHWLFCGITRVGVGVAYALVFGILFVKCIFLLKLHSGVYYNASYQGLLLFFIVAVEIAIVSQWLVYEPPKVIVAVSMGEASEVCWKSPLDRLQYLSYDMFLLFLVVIVSIRARSLRENNKEALYIGLSIGFALVLWVAWTAVSVIFDRRFEAPAEAFGLVATALVTFLLIFVPKAVQLWSQNRDHGSGSMGASTSAVYTPSFLRLQPHAVLPSSGQGTLIKQSNVKADYCRAYPSRIWHYDYPSFHQMEPPAISSSDFNSLKKSNSSYNQSHLY